MKRLPEQVRRGVLCCSLMKEMPRSPAPARVDDGAIKSNQISFLFVSRDPISLSLSKAVTEGKKAYFFPRVNGF